MNNYILIDGVKYPLLRELLPYKENIERKIKEVDFHRNVFLMMKYRNYNDELSEYIIETFEKNGLNCIRADMDEWNLTEDSILNPLAILYCCKYGVALFDRPEDGQYYSPNVAYELGIMHYQWKNCLILIHDEIKDKKPFDLIGKLHKNYSSDLTVKKHINNWVVINNLHKQGKAVKQVPLRVVVAFVKKGKEYLITRRKKEENKLTWGFPAGMLKPQQNEKIRVQEECLDETNIKINPLYKIGERIHPDTGTEISYWFCEYVSGNIKNKQPREIEEIKWLEGAKVLSLITSDLYGPLKEILLNGK